MAKEFNSEFLSNAWKRYFKIGQFTQSEKPKLHHIIFAELLLSSLVLIFWPIFLIAFIPYFYKMNKEVNERNTYKTVGYFYLDSFKSVTAGGAGIIICKNCFYKEEIVVSTHCYDPKGNFLGYRGFQCQTCGKFHKLVNSKDDIEYFCECGGELSKNKKVFCPICKSSSIEYKMSYMT